MACFSRALVLISFVLFSLSEAREILVGGKPDAWKIPSNNSKTLNQWAESSRFRVGDTLVWSYEEGKDSVLRVSKEDYEACNTKNAEEKYDDGNTKVKLGKPGPFFFISGAKGHCEQGQKLVVVVMSPRYTSLAPSPSPSSSEFEGGPAVAPTSSSATFKAGFGAVIMAAVFGFALV